MTTGEVWREEILPDYWRGDCFGANAPRNDTERQIMDIIATRIGKLAKIRAAGVDPYPHRFDYTHTFSAVHSEFQHLKEGEASDLKISVCGRLISRREMGKATFCHLQDPAAKLQIYIKQNLIGEEKYRAFLEMLDIGDFLGVTGIPFRTRTGELTVNVTDWTLLSKSLMPLPEKWHGLRDVEIRYRQRYLDLISNPDVRQIFVQKAKIIDSIRNFLNENGFIEVETPVIQHLPGGAVARPFKTFHNAFGSDFFLRIAPELFLKMLVVGGMEKIFEIGKSFRNEGVDRKHNPEFTMVEVYRAYSDYTDMMKLCRDVLARVTENPAMKDGMPDFKNTRTVTLSDLFRQYVDKDVDIIDAVETGTIKDLAKKLNVEFNPAAPDRKIFDHLFDGFIQDKLQEPTFVIDYPVAFSPLAKASDADGRIAERFELFVAGQEIANAYSELNDPLEQKKRFLNKPRGAETDEEVPLLDEEFIRAIEYGMPPCGGLGIGIDRLTMVLTGNDSIRDVLLFPLLRPETGVVSGAK